MSWLLLAAFLPAVASTAVAPSTSTRFDYLTGDGYIEATVKPEQLGGASFYAEISFRTTNKVSGEKKIERKSAGF